MRKVYVTVNADFSPEGKVTPHWFMWEDGRKFSIDRILDVRQAASTRAGGIGQRYTVRVMGKETYIWFEDNGQKWLLKGK
jgi:hypothetical protein